MFTDLIILAAGKGSRMSSSTPKVLLPLAGKPMLSHILDSALNLKNIKINVVIGHQAQQVKKTFSDNKKINWIKQPKQLGTGHAVKQAVKHIRSNSNGLFCMATFPYLRAQFPN